MTTFKLCSVRIVSTRSLFSTYTISPPNIAISKLRQNTLVRSLFLISSKTSSSNALGCREVSGVRPKPSSRQKKKKNLPPPPGISGDPNLAASRNKINRRCSAVSVLSCLVAVVVVVVEGDKPNQGNPAVGQPTHYYTVYRADVSGRPKYAYPTPLLSCI